MKRKNVILPIFAFVFAIGSAFTTNSLKLTSVDAYIVAKTSSAPTAPWRCVNTGIQCESNGSTLCLISVNGNGGGYLGYTIGKSGASGPQGVCVTELRYNGNIPISYSDNSIYAIQPW